MLKEMRMKILEKLRNWISGKPKEETREEPEYFLIRPDMITDKTGNRGGGLDIGDTML